MQNWKRLYCKFLHSGTEKKFRCQVFESRIDSNKWEKEPVYVEINLKKELVVSFVSTEAGKHLVDVQKNGRPIIGSLFEVLVSEEAVRKPSQQTEKIVVNYAVYLDI